MTIGIDMDDTICSTNELIIEEADRYDREVLKGKGVKDPTAYDFTEMLSWPSNMKGQFFYDRLEYIMANAKIKENAKEVINKLHDKGCEIVIITYRKRKYLKDPYELTKTWLEKNGVKFDKIFVDTGCKDDECVENDVRLFIDDKESHCDDVRDAGIDVILFTNEYNKEETRFPRANNWLEVYDMAMEKLNG